MNLMLGQLSNNINDNEKGLISTTYFAGNGIFEKRTSWLGTSTKKINDYKLVGYPNIEERLRIADADFPLIPKKALDHVIYWYRKVTKDCGDEAQVVFYKTNGKDLTINDEPLEDIPGIKVWTDDIFSYTPIQENGKAITSVSKDDKYYDELNKKFGTYVETHSHNSMRAFRSSTDEAYSYNDGVQLVFGQLDKDKVHLYSWVTIRELQKAGLMEDELKQFLDDFDDYNYTVDAEYNFMLEPTDSDIDLELINEWGKQVTKKPVYQYSYNKYNTPAGYYNNGYQYSYFNDKRKPKSNYQSYNMKDTFCMGSMIESYAKIESEFTEKLYAEVFSLLDIDYEVEPNLWDSIGDRDLIEESLSLTILGALSFGISNKSLLSKEDYIDIAADIFDSFKIYMFGEN